MWSVRGYLPAPSHLREMIRTANIHKPLFDKINLQRDITLRPGQNGCHVADDILKCIVLNEAD